ncbi:MAG: HAMP domain-containing sensor histidine kinase [Bacteroidota bacterium]
MLLKLNKYTYLFLAACILVAAAIIENSLLKRNPETRLIEEFQDKLVENEKILNVRLNKIGGILSQEDFDEDLGEFFEKEETLISESGFGFLIFEDGGLIFWTDRAISFFNTPGEFEAKKGFLKLPNGYYLADTLVYKDYEVVGLHLVKNNYTFENKYLQNTFFESYDLPDEYILDEEENDKAYKIYNGKGEFLFSLWPYGKYLCTTNQLYLPGFIYFLGLILLLIYFRREFTNRIAPFFIKLLALAAALFVVYWLHLIFQIPKVFFHLRFFGPDFFAINYWLPSLGDFFLLSLFFLFWIYNFAIDLKITDLRNTSRLPRKFIVALLLLFNASLYLFVYYFITELIANSTISFALNKITEISVQSALGIFSIGLLLFGTVFFTIRINEKSRDDFKLKELIALVIGIALFMALVQFIAVGKIYIPVLVLFIICAVFATLFSKKYLHTFTLSYLIIFVAVVSFYSLIVINQTISQKDREHQKLLAVTLVTERDPAAEVFLSEIQYRINEDHAIQSLLFQDEDVIEYIRNSYFGENTYLGKYQLKIYRCAGSDSLFIEPEELQVPCQPYLDKLIKSQGVQIPGTNFYFMDNMNGRISYSGRLHYPLSNVENGVTIYIDLDSDLLFEGIGFPELLIDKSMARSDIYRKFNYAKYYGGDLTYKFGEYNYNYNVYGYLTSEKGFSTNKKDSNPEEEFSTIKMDNLEHLIYHTRETNYVVVSRPVLTFVDYLISFPYLFVFYFLILLVIIIVGNQTIREKKIFFDLKFKIQAAIISIVFVSLMVVALVTIYYNVEEYKTKHYNDLNEKMKSIAEEIDNRLTDKKEVTPDLVVWLHRELAKLSNIFRTDINIYGNDGELIASSREEIFGRGLVSSKINARAYYELFQNFQISYFQPENIGQLSYLSAYRPILNDWGDYLGIINLPYFIKQDNYSQEISTFIVAFINLYVLLFLASIIAAVFIANQITRPLVVIQENLQKMELGKHNEPIHYNRKDEIGSLVKEYNKKVEELAVSADLLARSERESAWREMAKQIAHEIKNPLTPMKLNIQYLQRAKGKDKEYNKYLERVTATLIEQIDNLSDIATEFSNFAKIPTARNQIFCLSEQIQKVIDLYETHNRAGITFYKNNFDNVKVNADREQLSRAIINLIRNGIQSMPENKMGKITIQLNRREHMAVISVNDNGSGIPVELRDKLFSPSFTTKTSGMGLGLAIVKNIVENFSGKIWFETELGVGSTFFLEIPVYEEDEV